MNLEQSLELARRMQAAGFPYHRVFVSSNPADFAASKMNSHRHPDLASEFAEAGWRYFQSLQAAVGSLRAVGQFP